MEMEMKMKEFNKAPQHKDAFEKQLYFKIVQRRYILFRVNERMLR